MEINFAQVGVSLLVAIVTSLLTVWLSLKRFYREKWWERKMVAYTAIIESLHHLKSDIEVSLRAEEIGREIPDIQQEEMRKKYSAARSEILKNFDIGEFLLSADATKVLSEFEKSLDEASNQVTYYEHLNSCSAAISTCLKSMRRIARTDLKG